MRSRIWLWMVIASLLPILSYAQNADDSLVRELFVRSGEENLLDQLPSLILAGFNRTVQDDEQARKLPKNVLSAMRAAVPTAFAPEKSKETMLAELAGKLTSQDIKGIIQWLDSPLGKKCIGLEEQAARPEAQADMQQYAAGLREKPPTPERVKTIQDFDSALKETDSAVEIALQTQAAVALAFIATFPKEKQQTPDAVLRDMEKKRPAFETEVRRQTFVDLMYTYRNLTDDEIRQYTEFAKSPVGTKYSSVVMDAYKKIISDGAVKWGKFIGEAMQETKDNPET